MHELFNKKDRQKKNIIDQLESVAKEMLVTNSPKFNLRIEREILRISEDIDDFGKAFGADDKIFIRLLLTVDVLLDKLEKRKNPMRQGH